MDAGTSVSSSVVVDGEMDGEEADPVDGRVQYSAPIMLKSYETLDGVEVKRFALVAENLNGIAEMPLTADVMHPLEAILMTEAISELSKYDEPHGVLCDIFVRAEGTVIATGLREGLPETHCVALWREEQNIYLIDPSNSNFSQSLVNEMDLLTPDFIFYSNTKGALYGSGDKRIGRVDGTARDCIDIAVKIIFEMIYQRSTNPDADLQTRTDNMLLQLSTENTYAPHFMKAKTKMINRQFRDLTATSSEVRARALDMLQRLFS